jgi:hypothetical protein
MMDTPKCLRDPLQQAARMARIHDEHVAMLTAFVDSIRADEHPEVPYSNPLDGAFTLNACSCCRHPGLKRCAAVSYRGMRATRATLPPRVREQRYRPSWCLQNPHECDDVAFFLRIQLEAKHQVEELDRIFESEEPSVMQIRR